MQLADDCRVSRCAKSDRIVILRGGDRFALTFDRGMNNLTSTHDAGGLFGLMCKLRSSSRPPGRAAQIFS